MEIYVLRTEVFFSVFPLVIYFAKEAFRPSLLDVDQKEESIIGLAAVNDNSRSVLHLSRGRTGLGRGGPGAPPLPPAGPSTAGGPGYIINLNTGSA